MRIGHGFDIHKFRSSGKLILGGVEIPYQKGIEAHSDGDVLIHAICDALLGAAALGDIGKYFPDTDPNIKNISSRRMLKYIMNCLIEKNFQIINIDSTIITEKPKLLPYIDEMRNNIASDLQTEINQISIKATTMEKQGAIGAGEAIAAHAVVLIT